MVKSPRHRFTPLNVLCGCSFIAICTLWWTLYPPWTIVIENVHPETLVNPPNTIMDPPLLNAEYESFFPDLKLPSTIQENEPIHSALSSFLNRPLQTFEEAKAVNDETCPEGLMRGMKMFWFDAYADHEHGLSISDIMELRVGIVKRLESFVSDFEVGSMRGKGRGIVTTGGNYVSGVCMSGTDGTEFFGKAMMGRVLRLVRALRHEGCQLPVEVFHLDTEEVDTVQRRDLEAMGAVLQIVSDVAKRV
jgi:hypothetical protein